MAKNLNHYAVVICNEDGSPRPASSLFFSVRQEAVNAFTAIKAMEEKIYVRVYVFSSPIPVESSQIHSLMELCMETNEWLRHGWKILASEFKDDQVLTEYNEPLTNEENALVITIKDSLRTMTGSRAALVMKTVTNEYFLDAKFEA